MRREPLAVICLTVLLSAWGFPDTVVADDAPPAASVPKAPLPKAALPMRTEQPIVYATPMPSMIILEFKLYDNKTWCRLYIDKTVWEATLATGGKLPLGADKGQLQCEQR